MIISNAFSDAQLRYLRGWNPVLRTLYSGIGTSDMDDGPLGSRWISATAGSPELNCFYRGTDGQVLKVSFWNHGMFNMGDAWCRAEIVDHLVAEAGHKMYQVYDGVFFDRITQVITPHILDGIDLDHDGTVDDRDRVNALYWQGTERFLDEVRRQLGANVIVVANDAPLVYTSRLNGREYESFMRVILDTGESWPRFRYNYEQWMQASREPRLTMVMSNPPTWMEVKYGRYPWELLRGAALDEAAAYYQRMRFGLATTLLEGGLDSYEFGTTWHGNAWWYDEYDGAGRGKGYLGAPLGPAYPAAGPLTTTNAVQNPGFEARRIEPWALHVENAQASLSAVPASAPFTTMLSARIVVSTTRPGTVLGDSDDVRLEQPGIPLAEDLAYTLSFWGKASAQLWNTQARLHAGGQPAAHYGLRETLNLGTTWQQYRAPFTATSTVTNAVLSFSLGGYTGTVWIDEVRLQEGTQPDVYRRDFQRGSVLCNATEQEHEIALGEMLCRLDGTQAPLVKILIDDAKRSNESFVKIGGWAGHGSSDAHYYDCWGQTYHHALTTNDPGGDLSSATWRPNIVHADRYTVYAWAVPHPSHSNHVTYTIRHAGGITLVAADPQVRKPTWLNLGTYAFDVGTGNAVTLTNVSPSTWIIADAVKFESVTRYNNGECATSVTLAGQDGIILLNEPLRTYLPLVRRG